MKIKFGINQRRPAKSCENAAYPGWFPRDRIAQRSAKAKCFGAILSQATRKGADQVPISLAAQYLKPRETTLAKAYAIVLDGALLRTAHGRTGYFQ